MSKNEKMAFWVAGGIGVIVLLWLMVYRRTNVVAPSTYYPDSPNYMSYNYPGTQPWTGAANGLPTQAGNATYNIGGNSCCGCGSNSSPVMTNMQSMLDAFAKASGDNFASYQKAVYSSFPSTVTQYFNNPSGAAMYAGGSSTFRELQ